MLEVYLLFYQFALQVFVKMNLLLQREDPLVSRVNQNIKKFIKKLGCKFLTIDALSNSDPLTVNYEIAENQRSGEYYSCIFCSKLCVLTPRFK